MSEKVTTTNFTNSSSIYIDEITDTKDIIRTRKSRDWQNNDQTKKDKRTNNDLQNNTQKNTDLETRNPLKIRGELRCSGMVGSSCSTSGIRRATLVTNPVTCHEWVKDQDLLTTSRTHVVVCDRDISKRLTKSWCRL